MAALLAFVVAAAFLIVSMTRGRSPKLLEVTGAVVFAAFGIVGASNPAVDAFLADYGRSLATLILAVVIFVLLPIVPFTEQYARETAPQQYWHSPVFRSVNRQISAAWGAVIAMMGVGHALATLIPELGTTIPSRPVDLLLNWVVPALLSWWAVRYTARVSAEAHDLAVARLAHQN
ncbi:hypothetical protein [Pseudonocardia charpentierae]|nr:hypothetical protein [Pseudonocardia sp. DSM 45834]